MVLLRGIVVLVALVAGGLGLLMPLVLLLDRYQRHPWFRAVDAYLAARLAGATEEQLFLAVASMMVLMGSMLAAVLGWLGSTRLGLWFLSSIHRWAPHDEKAAAQLEFLASPAARDLGYRGRLAFLCPRNEPGFVTAALGRGTILVSPSVFLLSHEEIQALMAVEIAHLKAGTPSRVVFVYAAAGPLLIPIWLMLLLPLRVVSFLVLFLPGGFILSGLLDGIAGLVVRLLRAVLKLMLRVMVLGEDYRADAAAAAAGYGDRLLGALDRISKLSLPRPTGLHGLLWYLKPSPASRMARLARAAGAVHAAPPGGQEPGTTYTGTTNPG